MAVLTRWLAPVLVVLSFTACGGGDDPVVAADPADPTGPGQTDTTIPAEFVGLWDETEDLGAEGIDVGYINIDAAGTLTLYDYQGDTADNGADCSIIGSGTMRRTGGDNYTVESTLGNETETQSVQARVVSGELLVSYVDTDDEDGDGDRTETLTQVLRKPPSDPGSRLQACPPPSGGGGDPDPVDPAPVDPGTGGGGGAGGIPVSIIGLWMGSEDLGADGIDVEYVLFDGSGAVGVWDYQGDTADNGPNCSIVGRGVIASRPAPDTFVIDVTIHGERNIDTVMLERVGDDLRVSYVDVEDDDNDGDRTETISAIYAGVPRPYPNDRLTPCP